MRLPNVPFSFYLTVMPDSVVPSSEAIAEAILSASPVTRLGLAAPGERVRNRAARELASIIAAHLAAPEAIDCNQLALAL